MVRNIFAAMLLATVALLACAGLSRGQVGGNITFSESGGKSRAETRERAMRTLGERELPPSPTTMFVEANVLLNEKADEYVAIFGIAHEGETLADCSRKMEATVKAFSDELKTLGVAGDDLFVDFVAQNRIYGFQAQPGDILQERLVGFELKKNVSIRYTQGPLLEKITLAAARSQVFDLIKVDYVVKDLGRVQEKLMEEAARIVKSKVARHQKLLSIKLQPPAQVFAERFAVHYPTEMYDSYTAHESEQIHGLADRQRYTVQSARKSQTFFFNALTGDGFDAVLNPAITAPVVQCTVHLKVKYAVEQIKAQ